MCWAKPLPGCRAPWASDCSDQTGYRPPLRATGLTIQWHRNREVTAALAEEAGLADIPLRWPSIMQSAAIAKGGPLGFTKRPLGLMCLGCKSRRTGRRHLWRQPPAPGCLCLADYCRAGLHPGGTRCGRLCGSTDGAFPSIQLFSRPATRLYGDSHSPYRAVVSYSSWSSVIATDGLCSSRWPAQPRSRRC